ncbi:hypothetical protein AALA69_03175 [Eggerthellaceae bacterium 24-137]
MKCFQRGDYVWFYNACGDADLGRVAYVGEDGRVFVCFTIGCSAASCDPGRLKRVANPRPWMRSRPFGHHRFDVDCPDYDPECCAAFCPEKGGE